jgi:hypothetical protein
MDLIVTCTNYLLEISRMQDDVCAAIVAPRTTDAAPESPDVQTGDAVACIGRAANNGGKSWRWDNAVFRVHRKSEQCRAIGEVLLDVL